MSISYRPRIYRVQEGVFQFSTNVPDEYIHDAHEQAMEMTDDPKEQEQIEYDLIRLQLLVEEINKRYKRKPHAQENKD